MKGNSAVLGIIILVCIQLTILTVHVLAQSFISLQEVKIANGAKHTLEKQVEVNLIFKDNNIDGIINYRLLRCNQLTECEKSLEYWQTATEINEQEILELGIVKWDNYKDFYIETPSKIVIENIQLKDYLLLEEKTVCIEFLLKDETTTNVKCDSIELTDKLPATDPNQEPIDDLGKLLKLALVYIDSRKT
jgi:hypothetical protein